MLGTSIALNHRVALERHQELIAEAVRDHQVGTALGLQGSRGTDRLVDLRTFVARALLRTGTWLMPETSSNHPATGGLELRPGQ